MITLHSFFVAGSTKWNENGYLDATDIGLEGGTFAELPAQASVRVALILGSDLNEYETVTYKLAVSGPARTMHTAGEYLDPWPPSQPDMGFSRLQLTLNFDFEVREYGVHSIVLFIDGEPTSRASFPIQVKPSAV